MYGMKKVSKTEIKETITMDIMTKNPNVPFVNEFDEIVEKPPIWKHSCPITGVIVLPEQEAMLRDGVPAFYSFCEACGKVNFYVDIGY